ncbi:MFS transporter [Uliginosibacterium sediminicola]|uniref:MFS transporter n=1 Tax=Uliginosibacterium sediminicola TaxID=2024550 RepID=A0ABU9YTL5_9RHOO
MSILNPLTRRTALIVAAAAFMQMLDGAILNTSLPQMASSLGVQPVQMSVGITTYMLVVAIFMPLSAWLTERFGARRVFVGAILLFTFGSLICGLSRSLPEFIASRILQGLGGAMMVPVGRIIVLHQASKQELLEANTFITWPALVAPVIGPVLGGFITTYAGWRWNFLLNLPLGLAGSLLAWRYLPLTRSTQRDNLDWPGFIYTASALALVLTGLESLGHGQITRPVPWLLIGIGVILAYFALRHLARTATPLLSLKPFERLSFALSTLSAGTWVRIAVSSTPFLLPLLYQLGFGLSALEASSFLFAYFIGNLGMKAITTRTLRRLGFRRVLFVDSLLCGLSIAACALFEADTSRWLMFASLFCAGLTRSMAFTSLASLAFADISQAERNSASTLASMFQQLAMLLGVAVAALLLHLSQALHGHSAPLLVDFRWAFGLMGVLAVIAAFQFLRLPLDAGNEISGYKPKSAAADSQAGQR